MPIECVEALLNGRNAPFSFYRPPLQRSEASAPPLDRCTESLINAFTTHQSAQRPL